MYVELRSWDLTPNTVTVFGRKNFVIVVENACELNFLFMLHTELVAYSLLLVYSVFGHIDSMNLFSFHCIPRIQYGWHTIVFCPDDWNHRIWLIFNLILLNTDTHIHSHTLTVNCDVEIFRSKSKLWANGAFNLSIQNWMKNEQFTNVIGQHILNYLISKSELALMLSLAFKRFGSPNFNKIVTIPLFLISEQIALIRRFNELGHYSQRTIQKNARVKDCYRLNI